MPTEINDTCGLIPFADKSLTQADMLFLAICHGDIPLGTSVLSTSISHFRIRLFMRFMFPRDRVDTSSSFLLLSPFSPILEMIISIISLSFNLLIN